MAGVQARWLRLQSWFVGELPAKDELETLT